MSSPSIPSEMPGPAPGLADRPARVVACLCAGWCTTCQAYEATFADVARAHPGLRFAWIDIEDHADTLGDAALEIENFPTVMLLHGGRPEFFGTVLPHGATLRRMVEAAERGALAPAGVDDTARALAPGVWALAHALP